MRILTIKGIDFKLDEDIFDIAIEQNWYINNYGYACQSNKYWKDNKRVTETKFLHHLALPPKSGFDTDHINRDKTDCQRINLRYLEHWLNGHNRLEQTNNSSGKKGVSWSLVQSQWHAYIWIKGKRKHLGYYNVFEDAVQVREKAEQDIFNNSIV